MRLYVRFAARVILSLILALVALSALLALAVCLSGFLNIRRNEILQNERMARLREESGRPGASEGEERFAAFDLSAALEDGIRLNEVSFLATHNSYQPRASLPYRILLRSLSLIPGLSVDGGLAAFEMDGLTEQLEHGIRSLELDVEAVEKDGALSFTVTHFFPDNRSSCQDFGTALEELVLWSDRNPRHLPLIILIEPKTAGIPLPNTRTFDTACARVLDEAIRSVVGDRLLTPGDAMGSYESLAAMRADDGWPLLEDCLGRILFVLHPCPVTDGYIETDRSIRTQAMFPCLRYDRIREDFASFLLDNDPSSAAEHSAETVGELRLMVRTRADDYPEFSGSRYEAADRCGAQIVTTDYPPRNVRNSEHIYSFDGYTVRLNPDPSPHGQHG